MGPDGVSSAVAGGQMRCLAVRRLGAPSKLNLWDSKDIKGLKVKKFGNLFFQPLLHRPVQRFQHLAIISRAFSTLFGRAMTPVCRVRGIFVSSFERKL
jgi:hypothetical protein